MNKRMLVTLAAGVAAAGAVLLPVRTAQAEESAVRPPIYDVLLTDANGYFKTGYTPNLRRTKIEMCVSFTQWNSELGSGYNNTLFTANNGVAGVKVIDEQATAAKGKERYRYGNAMLVELSNAGTSIDWFNRRDNIHQDGGAWKQDGIDVGPNGNYAFQKDTPYVIVARNNTLTIDGVEPFGKGPEDSENDVAASSELVLLANCNAAKGPAEGYTFGAFNSQSPKKVYYVNIYETDADGRNERLVHRYLPAKNGDVATLWDEVTGEFLTPIPGNGFTVTCDHEWGEWSDDTATKFTGGRQMRACSKCQIAESRQTPQLWDYLKTDGKGYFKTGYVPNLARTEFKMNVRFHASAIGNQKGLLVANEDIAKRTKQYGNAINLNVQGYDPQNNFDYYNSNNGGSFYPPFDADTTKAHEIVLIGNHFFYDGTETTDKSMASEDIWADSELYFLATHSAGAQETRYFADCDVYGFALSEVTDGGATTTLVHKYRPAKDASGKATLYDEVTGEYLTVTGSGAAFSVGNDAEPEEPTIEEDPDEVPTTAYDAAHTIICYGDSLTEGDYADKITFDERENFFDGRLAGVTAEAGYPWWLANRIPTEYNVIAQARSGMCVDYMLGWQGGLKLRLSGPVTLPPTADTPVEMPSALIFDGAYKYAPNGWKWELSHTDPAKGDKWLGCGTPILPSVDTADKCVCDSVTGVLTGWICGKRVRLQSSSNADMTISRVVEGGDFLTLPAGATFTPDTAKLWPGHIHVILGGANDGTAQIDQYIADIKAAFAGVEKYVVVSPHCSWQTSYATKFSNAFGEHYLNLHDAMSTRGLDKAVKIGAMTVDEAEATTWNAGDGSGLLAGSVDSGTHFNTRGYKVLAAFVEEKLVELGYIPGHQHSWTEWEDTATDWEDGTQTRTCMDPECGLSESRPSPQKYAALKVDASGYFDTGLHPNLAKLYVEFDVEFDESRLDTGKLQGLMVASGGNALNINLEKQGATRGLSTVWDFDYYNNPGENGGTVRKNLYPAFGNTAGRHVIAVKGMAISVDGAEVSDHGEDALRDAPSTDTLKLLTTCSGAGITRYGVAGNVYSIKIGEVVGNDVVITHSYRPAKNGNVATLWDEIDGTFLTPLQISQQDSGGAAPHKPFQFSLVGSRVAGARTWTGAAGDSKWESNDNWSPKGAPEATEDVTLDSSIGDITALPSALLPTGKRTIALKTDGEHSISIKTANFAFEQAAYGTLALDIATKPGANGWLDLGANGFNMKYGVVRANLDGNRLKFNYFYDNTPGSEFIITNGASFVAGYQAELGNQETKMTLVGDGNSFMNCGSQITLKNKFQLTLVPTPDGEIAGAYLRGTKYVINSGLNVTVDVSAFAKKPATRTYTFMQSTSDSTINLPTATVVGEGAKNCTVTFTSPDKKTILMTVKSAPKGLMLILR